MSKAPQPILRLNELCFLSSGSSEGFPSLLHRLLDTEETQQSLLTRWELPKELAALYMLCFLGEVCLCLLGSGGKPLGPGCQVLLAQHEARITGYQLHHVNRVGPHLNLTALGGVNNREVLGEDPSLTQGSGPGEPAHSRK